MNAIHLLCISDPSKANIAMLHSRTSFLFCGNRVDKNISTRVYADIFRRNTKQKAKEPGFIGFCVWKAIISGHFELFSSKIYWCKNVRCDMRQNGKQVYNCIFYFQFCKISIAIELTFWSSKSEKLNIRKLLHIGVAL